MVYLPLFNCLFVYLFRQEAQNQPYTCPADRKRLDRDRVNHFHLPCNLFVYCVLILSIIYLFIYLFIYLRLERKMKHTG